MGKKATKMAQQAVYEEGHSPQNKPCYFDDASGTGTLNIHFNINANK